ncbi:MAG: hypothetical protein V1873_00815 [Verrucomicrobiota bacterium]
MSRHPSDREIIDCQFKLCSEALAGRIAEHLKTCPDCRDRGEELQQKLASLNELRDEVPASEQLIAETLRRIRRARPEPRASALIPRFAWITGAAAVAAVLVAVIYSGPLAGRRAGRGAVLMAAKPETADVAKEKRAEAAIEVAMLQPEEEAEPARGLEAEMPADEALEAMPSKQAASAPPPETPHVAAYALNQAADKLDLAAARDRRAEAPEATEGGVLGAKMAGRGMAAGALTRSPEVQNFLKEQAPMAEPPPEQEWSVEAPEGTTVSVNPALAGFDKDTLQTLEDTGKAARQWLISIDNAADVPASVRVTRTFDAPGWEVRLTNSQVAVSTQDATHAVLHIEAPPASRESFLCTVLTGRGAAP